jgi:hypothetical protein
MFTYKPIDIRCPKNNELMIFGRTNREARNKDCRIVCQSVTAILTRKIILFYGILSFFCKKKLPYPHPAFQCSIVLFANKLLQSKKNTPAPNGKTLLGGVSLNKEAHQ